ncbi:uncharacterized protein TrAtP1_000092 [Trichoderma atroviride]|uniref:uncharacterized protein n=1 Tax=Hypocrea atroviridis TaxID=63577 RepID=UPI00331FCC8D|nr:hypothetical protein TrAtP1_000092 [Trichoderma atroviride]
MKTYVIAQQRTLLLAASDGPKSYGCFPCISQSLGSSTISIQTRYQQGKPYDDNCRWTPPSSLAFRRLSAFKITAH